MRNTGTSASTFLAVPWANVWCSLRSAGSAGSEPKLSSLGLSALVPLAWSHGGFLEGKQLEETKDGVGAPLYKLSLSRGGLAVIFDVRLGCFPSMVHCVFMVPAG